MREVYHHYMKINKYLFFAINILLIALTAYFLLIFLTLYYDNIQLASTDPSYIPPVVGVITAIILATGYFFITTIVFFGFFAAGLAKENTALKISASAFLMSKNKIANFIKYFIYFVLLLFCIITLYEALNPFDFLLLTYQSILTLLLILSAFSLFVWLDFVFKSKG